jgi:GntR family transcriptional regulator, rspAB operon transcriptional repressor
MFADAGILRDVRSPVERPVQKAEQIYESLRHSIVRLSMVPGAVISEKALCLEYGVSRTPVREALKRLAEEGFVIRRALEIESIRRAVRFVAEDDIARLERMIAEMRDILDRGALHEYIEVDDAFHAAIAGISRYPRIWKFINQVKAHLDRMRQLSAPVPGHLAEVTEQHAAIVRAVERRNADQAELAMRIHLEASFEVMAAMVEDGGFFTPKDA